MPAGAQIPCPNVCAAGQSQPAQFSKTPLLSNKDVAALGAEISGLIAKDTVTELARYHRVQASSGFSRAAEYIAAKAKEYGLEQVQIERFPADAHITRRIVAAGLSKGVFLYPAGSGAAQDIIMLGPPFIITEDDLALLVGVLEESIEAAVSRFASSAPGK